MVTIFCAGEPLKLFEVDETWRWETKATLCAKAEALWFTNGKRNARKNLIG
jgi:hypothetical protein